MAKSLREQLLDAGLVDKKRAAQAQHEQRKQARREPKGQAAAPAVRQDAQQALADKAARDRELNRQRQEQVERKAISAQVEQLIKVHRIDTTGGDLDYRFVDRGVIKTLAVNPSQHAALVQGALALVRYRRVYALVPRAIAEKVAERDAGAVVARPAGAADGTAAADYAEYQVPDDLMW